MPQLSDLGSASLGALNQVQLICAAFDVTADASSGLAFPLPFELEIVNVIARSTATTASATVTVSNGLNAVTNAIDIDTLDTNIAATSIDTTHSTAQEITLTTATSNDRCRVFIIGIRTE